MENLTKTQDIVREVGDPRPIPGYSLVIFREENGGRVLHKVLSNRESFRPGFWERYKYQFVAYGVSDDPDLRYRFSHQLFFYNSERVYPFTVEVALLFKAAQPETLAEKLASDPLRRLRNEIGTLLERRAAAIPYIQVCDDSFDLHQALLQDGEGHQGDTEAHQTPFERFQAFAARVGFYLKAVEIKRSPSPTGLGRTEHEKNEQATRHKQAQSHETEAQRINQQGELESLRARNKHQARAIERVTELLDAGAAQLAKALQNIAHGTDSAGSLRQTIRQFVELRRELAGGLLAASPEEANQVGQAQLAGRITKALPGTGANGDPLSWEIEAMRTSLVGLDCRPSDLRTLRARILHLLAELSLGDDADEDRLESYARELHQTCESIQLGPILETADQLQYFRRLRDLAEMRRVFSPELDEEPQAEEVVDG